MRVFLAGATGVIGRRLVPLPAGRGHSVTGFVRRDADADWLRSLGAKAVPAAGCEWVPAFCRAVGVAPVPETGGERHGWARGASNEYARKELNWTPAWPSWREGFAAL